MSELNIIAITMPKWGMSMTVGKVVDWLEEEGTEMEKGDEILEIETEKTINVLEAAATGILVRVVAEVDDELPVGSLLGVIAQRDTTDEAIDTFVEEFQQNYVVPEIEEEADETPQNVTLENDITIAYQHLSGQQEGDNLPIILIHGFGGDQNGWLFNITDLSDCNDVYMLDLPGHGSSSKQVGDGSLAFLAKIISEFMTALDITKAHIVGHSLGGAIAASFAHQFHNQVASVTLICSLGSETEVNQQFIKGFLAANRRNKLKPYMQQLFANADLVNRDMIEDVLKARRIDGATECLRKIADFAILSKNNVNPIQDFSELAVPIQFIWGEQDLIAPAEQLCKLPTDIKVNIIEGAGHMVHMEAATTVNKLIREFTSGAAS